MATDIMAVVQFSDGTFGNFVKEGATAEAVTSVPTGGNGLAQASGIEIGQAYTGKVAVAAAIKVQSDSAQSGGFSYGYFLGPDGKIICPIQGGGFKSTGLPPLSKPIRMQNGITIQATFDTVADAVGLASLACYCSDGTSDVFFVKAVNNTKTELQNKDGSSFGQALTGKVVTKAYAIYSSTNGLNDSGAGNLGLYVETADGQLKYMFPTSQGAFNEVVVPYIKLAVPIRVVQNDTLSVMASL